MIDSSRAESLDRRREEFLPQKYDVKKGNKWLHCFQEGPARETARIILENLQFIEQSRFVASLTRLVQTVEQQLDARPYILLYGKPNKSEKWIANQVCDLTQTKPVAVATVQDPSEGASDQNSLTNVLREHPNIEALVILDDASYGGATLKVHLKSIQESLRLSSNGQGVKKIIAGSVFATNFSQERIRSRFQYDDSRFRNPEPDFARKIVPVRQEGIATVSEILNIRYPNDNDRVVVEQNLKRYFNIQPDFHPGMGLTYFWHKIPDGQSFPFHIAGGFISTDYMSQQQNGKVIKFLHEPKAQY